MGVTNAKFDFENLYQSTFRSIYRYIYYRIGNTHDTEEVVSETYLAAWKNFTLISPEVSPKSWLFGIAAHKLNDFLRRKYKVDSNFLPPVSEATQLDPSIYLSGRNPIANSNNRNSTSIKYLNLLEELVKQLPAAEQEFIDLRFSKNYKLAEVAKELNITENNAKVRQNRIIKKLKKLWEQRKN